MTGVGGSLFRPDRISWPLLPNASEITPQTLAACVNELGGFERLPVTEVTSAQLAQLGLLVSWCMEKVPYLRNSINAFAGDLRGGMTSEMWHSLPVLERPTLQELEQELLAAPPAGHGRTADVQTSGSTGRPVRVRKTEFSSLLGALLILREHEWHRRDYRGTLASLRWFPDGVNTYPKGGNWPSWQGPIAALHEKTGSSHALATTASVDQQVEWLGRVQPNYLMLYPSLIPELIHECSRQDVVLSGLRELMTFGEHLDPTFRELCREAWGAPIKDVYSAVEVGCIAIQCPEHEHYHVQSENVFLEILRDDGSPCDVGEVGRVVVTPLHAFAMPLIRYAIGDYAELGEPCSCGRTLPVLKRILGRARNIVITPEGRSFWPRMGQLFYSRILPIKQFQVVQKTLSQLEVRLVAERRGTPDEEAALRSLIVSRMGYPFEIAIAYVDDIPRGSTGKFDDFKSELAEKPSPTVTVSSGARGVPAGWFSRSRSLAHYDAKFGAGRISEAIAQAIGGKGAASVLEIGCGEGRVLLELRKAFPSLSLYGMNREPWPAMQGSESLRETAVRYEIFDEREAAGLALPTIVFGNASALPFAPRMFDVVISQVTVPYVERKDWMLEEVWRTLKPGGRAFLHIDSTRKEESDLLCGDTPTLVVHRGSQRVPLSQVFDELKQGGFDLAYEARPFDEDGQTRRHFLLVMTKNRDERLDLASLAFDEQGSFDLTRLHRKREDWDSLWGYRSVYQLDEAKPPFARTTS